MNLEKQTVLDLDSIQVDQHGNFVINKQVVTIYNERYPEDQLSPTFLKKVHTQLRHIEETLDFNAEIRGEIKRMKSIMTIKHFETFIKSFLLDRDYTEIEHNGKVEKLTNSFWKMIKMEHF
jgi:frataxin-like iron-binding protein CyaY